MKTRVSSGFPKMRKLIKAPGCKAKYFKCFRVFGNPDAQVFETASQLHLRDKRKLKYSQIFCMLSASLLLQKIVLFNDMVISLFRKGVSNVITMLRFLRCWHLSAALARKK